MPETSQNNTSNPSSSNPSLNPVQDPASVYYIHPSENHTVPLVSDKFNGENYTDWKRGMILALSMKNKLVFVDGSLKRPAPNDSLYNAWERCNNMIISYLLRSLDNTIAKSVLYFSTAREIWQDMEDRYSVISRPQLYSVQQSLTQIEQGSCSIAEFFTKIKVIWDQISSASPIPHCTCSGCTCDLSKKFHKAQQEERLIQFLMKLDVKYAAVRTNILMMTPLPSISVAYNLLVQDEKQREITSLNNHTSTMAFAATDDKKSFDSSYRTKYHTNPGRRGFSTSLYCDHCKIPGHTMDRC